jgi:hypothetical protein
MGALLHGEVEHQGAARAQQRPAQIRRLLQRGPQTCPQRDVRGQAERTFWHERPDAERQRSRRNVAAARR